MRIKKIFITFSIIAIAFLFIAPNFILAAENESGNTQSTKTDILKNTKSVGGDAGYADANKDTLIYKIADVIKISLSLLGIIFLVLTLISGFQWMTAQGNEDAVKKAKARIKNATIGLIIIVASYSITALIESII